MPIIQIQVSKGATQAQLAACVKASSQAVCQSLGVPEANVFVTLSEVDPQLVLVAGQKSQPLAVVQASIKAGRTLALKQALLHALRQTLHEHLSMPESHIKVFIVDMPEETFL